MNATPDEVKALVKQALHEYHVKIGHKGGVNARGKPRKRSHASYVRAARLGGKARWDRTAEGVGLRGGE